MTELKSEFLHTIKERGFFHQATNLEALDEAAAKGVITGYIGFDATADSFHVGNLVQITFLRWLQKTGHRPITLMGGGTTKVGDPSGKDELRKMRTDAEIDANIASLQRTFSKFLHYGDGPADAVLVNNAEWLDQLGYIPFLRDVGRHFSINRMLTFDSVKLRLEREQPLSFIEFNYMVLQGYDFAELHRRYGCTLQMGGSDQWGNIVNGVDLGRRMLGKELFGLTTPLITTASGAKMGKTADGAVWLNADRRSPYDYYQFWRNTDDADVGRFLKLFTELPMDEIARLAALGGAEINEAKKVLALEATTLCHGREAAEAAAQTARRTFEDGAAAEGLPTFQIKQAELPYPIVRLLVTTGLAASNGEAKRLIGQGGISLNDQKLTDETLQITTEYFRNGALKLSAGKKRHVLVNLT